MSPPVTLVVDDEPDIRELLEITLNRMDIQTAARPIWPAPSNCWPANVSTYV